ncbi:MAG: 50S ribosomal protein L17, partial [Thermodesulfobacteria bacterium]|nr:50S ribosomal protein L17 [Thermodesulfobacteriota bacterium]
MRHRKRSRRLVGKWEHRKALMRNLLVALFVHERIRTTEAKAKELRRWADKMITLAKRGDLNARRQALSILPDKAVVRKLFSDIRERYLDRDSGFTRIVRIGPRRGDAAMMVFIELVTDKLEHKRSPKKIREDAEAASMAPQTQPEAEAAPEEATAEEAAAQVSEETP